MRSVQLLSDCSLRIIQVCPSIRRARKSTCRNLRPIFCWQGNLTPEQIAYLEKHTVNAGELPNVEQPTTPAIPASAETSSSTDVEHVVKGKTTFGELILWGVPQSSIEELIGGPLPNSALTLKDYASTNGLDFETLKTQLQAEVDKATK